MGIRDRYRVMSGGEFENIVSGLRAGSVIPFLGPGVLALSPDNVAVPTSPEALVKLLVSKVSVPHKIRNNLTAAAQFIENFKHRKTLVSLMNEAFNHTVRATELHTYLASLSHLPLIVDVWYDNAMAKALDERSDWAQIHGLSQSEHFGQWTQACRFDGMVVDSADCERWKTLLYKPKGSIAPGKNYLVSDSDYVELLTEIDIQTPIPAAVQHRRAGRNFLFLGCRFADQLERTFARQIMKRSSAVHWVVLPEPPTKNEVRFMKSQNIERIDTPLAEFVSALLSARSIERQRRAANG